MISYGQQRPTARDAGFGPGGQPAALTNANRIEKQRGYHHQLEQVNSPTTAITAPNLRYGSSLDRACRISVSGYDHLCRGCFVIWIGMECSSAEQVAQLAAGVMVRSRSMVLVESLLNQIALVEVCAFQRAVRALAESLSAFSLEFR